MMTQGRTILAGVISALPATALGSWLQGYAPDWLTVCLISMAVLGTYVVALRLVNPQMFKELLQLARGIGRRRPVRTTTEAEEILNGS